MREFVNLEQTDHTMTKRFKAELKKQINKEKSLLQGDAFELIKGIELVKPAFYFNRMLALHYPDDEYALSTGGDYDSVDADLRNALVRKKLAKNIKGNSVVLRGRDDNKKEYKNVDSVLTNTEDSHGSLAYKLDRDKVLLVALVFNLTYEETVDLMKGCVGCLDLNFKDPYEVILTYCLFEYEDDLERNPGEEIDSVYTRYTAIREKYEKEFKNADQKYSDVMTEFVKGFFFEQVENEEQLLEFVLGLPSSNPSVSATGVFETEAQILHTVLKNIKREHILAEKDNQIRSVNKRYLSADIIEFQKGEEIDSNLKSILIDDEKLKKMIKNMLEKYDLNTKYSKGNSKEWGHSIRSSAFLIKNLKNYYASDYDIKQFLAGKKNDSITREYIIQIAFFNYCFLKKRDYFVFNEYDSKAKAPFLEQLYYNFKIYTDELLNEAGFKGLYLPNYFESFIVFCLMTENPIDTFSKIMNKEI